MGAAIDTRAVTPSATILVVDDTRANRLALSAVLEPLGIGIVEAESGLEALKRVEEQPFALMLLDVQMPQMDGFECAARVRELDNGRELPIIFMTAIHRDEKYARRGYAVGAADYITKPFDVEVLRARVKAFVDLFVQREAVRKAEVALRTRERDEAVRRLVAFEQIATAALETDDLEVFLRRMLDVFLGAADTADSVTILIREGNELRVRAAVCKNEAGTTGASVKIGDGFAGAIAKERRPLHLADASAAVSVVDEWLRAHGTRGLFGVPLMSDGDVIGVAHIGSTRATTFSEPEKRMLAAMAERAAWAVAKQLERSRLHEVLKAAPALICMTKGADHRFTFTNPAYRSLFGGRDLVGQSARATLGPVMAALKDKVFHTGETFASDELRLEVDWAGNGTPSERFFATSVLAMRDAVTGDVDGTLTYANDVTAQVLARREREAHQAERARLLERERAARAEAEIANRAKDEFLATVSHELRTPLNAILGWTEMARAKAPQEVMRALSIVERNARAQARIIEDVLDISRIVSGKLRLETAPISVQEPIQGAIEAVRPAAQAKSVRLDTVLQEVGPVVADPDRLQQIVWNLLSNAIKFTPAGGQVTLRVSRQGQRLAIEVVDTGMGIEAGFLPYLFDPFRQADGSTTRRHGGLGLGLAIAKQLVQAHGGVIEAHSAGVGEGSTFTVSLPLHGSVAAVQPAEPAGPARAAATAERTGVRLDNVKVLVVDDEEDARELLADVFGEQGAIVSSAGSTAEALVEIERFRPDVLVSDIGMPGADGYTLIRSVRTLPPERGGRTPAIALTAYARAEDLERAFAAGFQRHVAKPVELGRLISMVANLGGLTFGEQ